MYFVKLEDILTHRHNSGQVQTCMADTWENKAAINIIALIENVTLSLKRNQAVTNASIAVSENLLPERSTSGHRNL